MESFLRSEIIDPVTNCKCIVGWELWGKKVIKDKSRNSFFIIK